MTYHPHFRAKVPNKGLAIGHYYHITLKNLVGMQLYEKTFYSP